MKPITHNNLGRKYLVEDCKKIRIDTVVKSARNNILETLIRGFVEIEGFQLNITNHVLHHGGKRLWFECPICKQPCGIIYKHPIEYNLVGCRGCLNLDYKCRRFKGMVENKTLE